MDVLPRITRQLIELFRAMSPLQRVTSVAVPFAVLIAFGWLVLNQSIDLQAVSFGKSFSTEELAAAEQALIAKGLTGYRLEGRRLMVSGKDLDRYNAALLEFDALPADLGSQMLKQYESLGPFSTDRQRQQMKEAMLLQELRRMIKFVPDIEDAHVAIASSERRIAWNQKPRTTANVTVKPRGGREISATLVNSLRHVVANMVPDLRPADVTIFDVSRGQAYTGEPTADSSDSRYLQRAREFTRQYEQQIQKALSHIPNIGVVVHVDLDALKMEMNHDNAVRASGETTQPINRSTSSDDFASHQTGFRGSAEMTSEPIRELSEKQLVLAMPKAVQVSVSIPKDYFRELATRRSAKGEKSPDRLDPNMIEDEVVTKVEQIVGRLIPAGSASDAVSVTCVERLGTDTKDLAALSTNGQLMSLARRWGGPIALCVFSLLTLVAMRRGRPADVVQNESQIVEFSEVSDVASAPVFNSVPIQKPPVAPDRAMLLRDEIRSMVESDPAASATLLMKWLAEAQS